MKKLGRLCVCVLFILLHEGINVWFHWFTEKRHVIVVALCSEGGVLVNLRLRKNMFPPHINPQSRESIQKVVDKITCEGISARASNRLNEVDGKIVDGFKLSCVIILYWIMTKNFFFQFLIPLKLQYRLLLSCKNYSLLKYWLLAPPKQLIAWLFLRVFIGRLADPPKYLAPILTAAYMVLWTTNTMVGQY